MNIERLFGKGREPQAKTRGKDEAKSRRPPAPSPDVKAPVPRIEAKDAPAAPARSGGVAVAKATPEAPIAVAPVPGPSFDEISARAYDLWQSQGRPEGRERENWIEAERQLREERTRN
jgi:DUF2934 family protein